MKNLCIIALIFLVICHLFTINALAEPWYLSIMAEGQGLQVSNITIGMDNTDIGAWPPAPSMPNLAPEIKIIDPNSDEYSEVIGQEDSNEDWTFNVTVGVPTLPDPNTGMGDPNTESVADANSQGFFPTLFWNPNEIVSNGFMQIRLGDKNGPVSVGNMKTTTTYQTTQDDALATGYYDPDNNKALMRYTVIFWTSPVDTQSIELIPGWNWVSFNVLPDDTSLESFFGVYNDLIDQVKTQTRSATNLLPPGPGWIGDDLNLLSNISQGVMFKIKTNAETAFTLNVTGMRLPQDMTIGLQQNWTWIAYLPPNCYSVEDVTSSILADLFQIKSQTESKTKIGGSLMGDLTDMCPGKGYVVNMTVPGFLTYPTP